MGVESIKYLVTKLQKRGYQEKREKKRIVATEINVNYLFLKVIHYGYIGY